MARLIILLLLILAPMNSLASAQESTPVGDSEIPIWVAYCDEMPDSPDLTLEQLIDDHGCTAGDGVLLTFFTITSEWEPSFPDNYAIEIGADTWYQRCETGADGTCSISITGDTNQLMGIQVHHETTDPAYVSQTAGVQRVPYETLMDGYGVVFVADDEEVPAEDPSTLTMVITRDGDARPVLTEWKRGYPAAVYLATDDTGTVTRIVEDDQMLEVWFFIGDDEYIDRASCFVEEQPDVQVKFRLEYDDMELRTPANGGTTVCEINLKTLP